MISGCTVSDNADTGPSAVKRVAKPAEEIGLVKWDFVRLAGVEQAKARAEAGQLILVGLAGSGG